MLTLCCVVFFIILMGVYPKMFLKKMDTSVQGFLAFVKERNAYYSTMTVKQPAVAVKLPGAGSR